MEGLGTRKDEQWPLSIFVFWPHSMWDHRSPTRNLTCRAPPNQPQPHWKHRVLTTGQPGKTQQQFLWLKKNFFFEFEDKCFKMLCWFLPYNNMNQPSVYTCPLAFEPPSHSSSIPPLWLVTEHWVELPVLYNNFPLAIYFTYGDVYVSMLLSQFVPPFPLP